MHSRGTTRVVRGLQTSIGSANIASISSCTLSRVRRASCSSSFNFASSKTPQSNAVRRAMSYLEDAVRMASEREAERGGGATASRRSWRARSLCCQDAAHAHQASSLRSQLQRSCNKITLRDEHISITFNQRFINRSAARMRVVLCWRRRLALRACTRCILLLMAVRYYRC